MKLIVGLGNPESRFHGTRHNIGFAVIDAYAKKREVSFASQPKLKAEIASFSDDGQKILLAKPMTFYNETGQSVRAIMDFYKLSMEDILIVHDELMLSFGKIRVRHSGQDAGNNGLKSVHTHIGDGFARVRIGIATEQRRLLDDVNFVLGKFDKAEHEILDDFVFPKTQELIDQFLDGELVDDSFTRPEA